MERERHSEQPNPELLPATRRLIDDVERETGRPIVVRPDVRVAERGRALYAVTEDRRDRDLVLYDPEQVSFLDHLIGHEAGHILRFHRAAPEDRLVTVLPESGRRRALEQLYPEIERLIRSGLPMRALPDLIPLWLSGTVAQLSDTPSDIWIERWLWDEYPGLRDAQRASLEAQARMLGRVMGRQVEAVTPPTIWLTSNAMNFALLSTVSELLDEPVLLAPYRNSQVRRMGRWLLDAMPSSSEGGLAADRDTSWQWAELLNIPDWLDFQRLDELPPGSRHAWE